jgi:hypothetical protein
MSAVRSHASSYLNCVVEYVFAEEFIDHAVPQTVAHSYVGTLGLIEASG